MASGPLSRRVGDPGFVSVSLGRSWKSDPGPNHLKVKFGPSKMGRPSHFGDPVWICV